MKGFPTCEELLGMLLGLIIGWSSAWVARELSQHHCYDSRFIGHRHWDLSVECRK